MTDPVSKEPLKFKNALGHYISNQNKKIKIDDFEIELVLVFLYVPTYVSNDVLNKLMGEKLNKIREDQIKVQTSFKLEQDLFIEGQKLFREERNLFEEEQSLYLRRFDLKTKFETDNPDAQKKIEQVLAEIEEGFKEVKEKQQLLKVKQGELSKRRELLKLRESCKGVKASL